MATWNHRLVEHRYEDERVYLVHEVHYDETGKPEGFTAREQSPSSRWEAKKMLEAFDKPVVGWVDDKSAVYRRVGDSLFPDWKDGSWGFYSEDVWYKEDTQADNGPVSDEEDLGDVYVKPE